MTVPKGGDMKKEVTVKPRINYGTECYDPACELSHLLCAIAHTKCVGVRALETLAKHGFSIRYIALEESFFLESIGAVRK